VAEATLKLYSRYATESISSLGNEPLLWEMVWMPPPTLSKDGICGSGVSPFLVIGKGDNNAHYSIRTGHS
jgi:hypothetical protein